MRAVVLLSAVAVVFVACAANEVTKVDINIVNARLDGIEARMNAATPRAATPAREAVTVISKTLKAPTELPAGLGSVLQHCVTFRVAGATEEKCKPFRDAPNLADTVKATNKAVTDCWTPIKVGDELPDCWR